MSEDWYEETEGDKAASSRRVYVDTLHIDVTLSEIRFDLSQAYGRSPEAGSLFPFVTQPEHLVSMGQEIDTAVARYRSRFGDIVPSRDRGNG